MNARDPPACAADWAAAQAGDARAISALVREHQRMVYSLGLRLLRNRAAAEDLTQEVFMQFIQHLRALDDAAHARHWLLRVTTHRAIDQLRRAPSRPSADDVLNLVDEREPGDPLLGNRLRALLGELAPQARTVIVLRYQMDMDPTEIAALLDTSLNTVKSHLRRSLDLLRERLT